MPGEQLDAVPMLSEPALPVFSEVVTRAVVDDEKDLSARAATDKLLLGEPGRGTRRNPGDQAVDAGRFVPLEPAIYGAARHAGLGGEVYDAPLLDVTEYRTTSSPAVQVPSFLGALYEIPQPFERRRRTSARTDRLPVLRRATTTSRVIAAP